MNDEKKTEYTRLALALCGLGLNEKASELVWRVIERLNEKGDQFSLKDAVEIELKVNGKVKQKKVTAV